MLVDDSVLQMDGKWVPDIRNVRGQFCQYAGNIAPVAPEQAVRALLLRIALLEHREKTGQLFRRTPLHSGQFAIQPVIHALSFKVHNREVQVSENGHRNAAEDRKKNHGEPKARSTSKINQAHGEHNPILGQYE
ncbi:hypothetical protein [Paraburkholderia strydomiana]|uniref:hypothetical protein n=1 Tax=Paraburkholderia strydomiana TaxID=1245417 RepID=UPI0038BD11F0